MKLGLKVGMIFFVIGSLQCMDGNSSDEEDQGFVVLTLGQACYTAPEKEKKPRSKGDIDDDEGLVLILRSDSGRIESGRGASASGSRLTNDGGGVGASCLNCVERALGLVVGAKVAKGAVKDFREFGDECRRMFCSTGDGWDDNLDHGGMGGWANP